MKLPLYLRVNLELYYVFSEISLILCFQQYNIIIYLNKSHIFRVFVSLDVKKGSKSMSRYKLCLMHTVFHLIINISIYIITCGLFQYKQHIVITKNYFNQMKFYMHEYNF